MDNRPCTFNIKQVNMNIINKLYYNSHDTGSKNPFGALRIGENVRFNVLALGTEDKKTLFSDVKMTFLYMKAEDSFYINGCKIENESLIEKPMILNGNIFSIDLSFNELGLILYFMRCDYIDEKGNKNSIYIGNSKDNKGGICLFSENIKDVTPYQITIYKERNTPEWYKKANFYQIFPDRFYNGNENGRVNSPKTNSFIYGNWYDSPMYIKNVHGGIERWDFFGGNLQGIIKKLDYLKDLGITGIYLNPIFKARSNHRYDTGDYHSIDEVLGTEEDFVKLIEETQKRDMKIILDGVFNHTGKDSKYFNIYGTYDSIGATQSKDSKYYSWYNFKNYPNTYDCWWGIDDLPNVNENDPGFRDFILNDNYGVVPTWIRKGAAGWRLDVADELPDEFIANIREAMDKANPDTVLMGEVWEDATNKIAYDKRRKYLDGYELNSVMNYPFKNNIIEYLIGNYSSEKVYREFMSIKENYPREAFYSNFNFLGTHDTTRIRTELANDQLLKMAIRMLYTLPGVPSLYYGDEAGLTGMADPNNRMTYPWGRENKDIMEWYKESIKLRNSTECFVTGEFQPFFTDNLFGYFRYNQDEVYLIAVNNSSSPKSFNLNNCKNNMDNKLAEKIYKTKLLENIPINPYTVKIFKVI